MVDLIIAPISTHIHLPLFPARDAARSSFSRSTGTWDRASAVSPVVRGCWPRP